MIWLKGKAPVRVQEVKVVQEAGDSRFLLQAPTDFRNRLWLTLRGGEEGAECVDLVHEPQPFQTPYVDLAAYGRRPDHAAHLRPLIGEAEGFGTRWGLPMLPPGSFQKWVFWEIYCFPLGEFRRMACLVSALDLLLNARYADREGTLLKALTKVAGMPQDRIIPWGGDWAQPEVLRGGKSRVWYFQTASGPMLTATWKPDLTVQFTASDIPEAFQRDPYNPMRLLPYRLGTLQSPLVFEPPLRSLPEMQEYCDRIRLGVKAYVETAGPSLWSFILEEWVQRYDRGNRTAYCSYRDPQGRPCGSPLPLSAPSNRQYCNLHQEVRALERKRASATRRRHPPSGDGPTHREQR